MFLFCLNMCLFWQKLICFLDDTIPAATTATATSPAPPAIVQIPPPVLVVVVFIVDPGSGPEVTLPRRRWRRGSPKPAATSPSGFPCRLLDSNSIDFENQNGPKKRFFKRSCMSSYLIVNTASCTISKLWNSSVKVRDLGLLFLFSLTRLGRVEDEINTIFTNPRTLNPKSDNFPNNCFKGPYAWAAWNSMLPAQKVAKTWPRKYVQIIV